MRVDIDSESAHDAPNLVAKWKFLMPSITIKSLPVELHERLKSIALRNRRSLQSEIVSCLERHVERVSPSKDELLVQAARLRAKLPPVDHGLVGGFRRSGRP